MGEQAVKKKGGGQSFNEVLRYRLVDVQQPMMIHTIARGVIASKRHGPVQLPFLANVTSNDDAPSLATA